jgi:hypothetical protein
MVLIGGALATFVASVMGEQQNDRLRNGTFGALAGSSAGGLAAIVKNEPNLVLFGFFGSTVGAFCGWLAYLLMSFLASTSWGRRLLVFHANGLPSVLDQIQRDDEQLLQSALEQWRHSFSLQLARQRAALQSDKHAGGPWMRFAIENWLAAAVEVFNLVLEALAKKPGYSFRVTIIVFGVEGGHVVGRHWLKYAGRQPDHRTRQFDDQSIAFRVLSEQCPTPYLAHTKDTAKQGQERGPRSYHAFYAFRLNEYAVLSLDWPGDLSEDDPYLRIARDFFHTELNPAITDMLSRWPVSPCAEVDLGTLATLPAAT